MSGVHIFSRTKDGGTNHGLSQLTPWSRLLLKKLTDPKQVKKFAEFYGTRKFTTAFTSAHQLSQSWAGSIQSVFPYPIFWR